MGRLFKKLGFTLMVLGLVHLVLISTGHRYIYSTLQNTILKGRLGPEIDEYKVFSFREVKATNPIPLPEHLLYNQIGPSQESMSQIESLDPVAFLVLKNDSVVYEKYWEGYSDSSLSNSFSAAKSFINVAIGVALREGHIKSLDQRVSDFLPDFNVGREDELTIRHLLMMSSGVDFDENYINPFAFPARANYGTHLSKLVLNYKVSENPGKTFAYKSGNTQLLAMILERAAGMSVSDYFSKYVWSKVGAERNALWSLDKSDGLEKAFCCFNANARDFSRIGLLYLHEGKLFGNRIVDADFVRESTRPTGIQEVDGSLCNRYGLHWWVQKHQENNVYYARGILGQYIIVLPHLNMVLVRLGHKRIKPKKFDPPADLIQYLEVAESLNKQIIAS